MPARYRDRPLVTVMVCGVLFGVASLLDHPTFRYVESLGDPFALGDAYWMFRVVGFWPTWLIVSLALLLVDLDRARHGWRAGATRAGLLLGSVTLSGIVAEVVKIAVRRTRPTELGYAFRPWAERTFDTGGLALPSSHAAVAFGGVSMLCWLFPRAAPVWVLLGVGCGLTRLADNSHYLSDVTASAILGYAAARLLHTASAK